MTKHKKCVGHFIEVIESSSQSYKITICPCFTDRSTETQRLLARGGSQNSRWCQSPAIHELCDLGQIIFSVWLSLLTVKMSDNSIYSLKGVFQINEFNTTHTRPAEQCLAHSMYTVSISCYLLHLVFFLILLIL